MPAAALLHTSISGLPAPKVGKVREVYDLGTELLIVATDRISAFDVIMANGVPDKGGILTQMSSFWFEKMAHLCPTHIISTDASEIQRRCPQVQPELNGRSVIAKKAKPLTIECVARAYISGSLFKDYRRSGPDVHGIRLPEGLVDSSRLPEPIFTPATKAEVGHDENISFAQACDLVGVETATFVRDKTLEIFAAAVDHAGSVGLILADTKFEFGLTGEGVIWIDEALTPDSSRFWEAAKYEAGRAQDSFDKQFVRDYLESIGWGKVPPGPTLPDDIIQKTRAKYLEAFERVVGREFVHEKPILD